MSIDTFQVRIKLSPLVAVFDETLNDEFVFFPRWAVEQTVRLHGYWGNIEKM